MDPLSISTSIAGLLALTGTVIQYLSSIEEASEERGKLLLEVSSASGLLYSLKDICEQIEPSSGCSMSLKSLCAPQGPFEQFKKALELLARRLAPGKGLVRAKRALTWIFDKREIDDLMKVVERQKTYFLLALQGNNVKLSQELAQSITAVDQRVERIEHGIRDLSIEQNRQGSEQTRKHDSDVLTWLSPTTFATKQKNVLLQAQPGTGQWIFTENAFMDWLASPMSTQTLWLPGIPGSGKTTLASIIIDKLERDYDGQSEVGIVYIFCDYKDSTQTSDKFKRVVLRGLLHQLDELPKEIDELYQNHSKRSTEPSAAELDKALHLASSRFSRLFYIVDALDELSEADGVVESLLELSKNLHSDVKSLFTSRWTAKLNNEIQREAQIQVYAQDQDIHTYLSHEIDSRSTLQPFVRKEPQFKDQIINTVLKNCKGMFLVARLHIESLATKLHLRAAKLALQQLPNSIDGVYENALDRVGKQQEEHVALAWKVLSWTVCTVRRLSSRELQHALAVEDDSDEMDTDALIDVDLILSVCAGLVVLDPQDSTVRLVHYTAEEFFKGRESKLLVEANHDIARICIQYISFRGASDVGGGYFEPLMKMKEFPLLEYAASNWGKHFAKCQNNPEVELDNLVESFLNDTRCLAAYRIMRPSLSESFGSLWFPKDGVNGLHLACYFGLTGMIERLLEKYDLTSQDSNRQTPLHWTIMANQPLAAKLLLKNGGEVDAQDRYGFTALHIASHYGHLEVALVLIEHGCDIEKRTTDGDTPFLLALNYEVEDFAVFLINQGADLQALSSIGSTPLHVAANGKKLEKSARLLLQKGVNLDVIDRRYWRTPLMVAAESSNIAVMRCLLEAGASKNLKNKWENTALHRAVRAQAEGSLSLLLEYGADTNLKDSWGRTPLHRAVVYGYLTCISILISVTNLDLVDNHGRTVLHAAVISECRASEIVLQILNTQKVDIDATDNDGWSALAYAKKYNSPKIEQLLLDAGANPALQNRCKSSRPFSSQGQQSEALRTYSRNLNNKNFDAYYNPPQRYSHKSKDSASTIVD